MSEKSPSGECRHCGTEYEPEHGECPNCGHGFFMPPVSDDPACGNCGEPFDRHQYDCPDCGANLVSTL